MKRPLPCALVAVLELAFTLYLVDRVLAVETDLVPALRAGICLNGEWEVAAADDDQKIPTTGWTPARIPAAPIVDRGVKVRWQRLVFEAPKEWSAPGRQFFLELEKVGHYAAVFCNGQLLGQHYGQYSPFEVGLAGALRFGQTNELVIYIHNASGRYVRPGAEITDEMVGNAYRPAANQQDQRNWIGIVGDVTLSWRPETRLADVFVITSVREKTLQAFAEIRAGGSDAKPLSVRASVLDDGKPVLELSSQPVPGDGKVTLAAPWADPVLWGSAPYGEPKLYTLRAELVSGSEVKWHPGHYAFVQSSKLDEGHLYKNFRGVQKTYTWRTLEPEKDRYDFSEIRADLAFLGRHDRCLVIQIQTKTFGSAQNYCPAYLAGPDYGGGVYRTRFGSFNPIIWNEAVNRRLKALYAQLGKALDREPFLEVVVIPESATTFENEDREKLHYTAQGYIHAVESGMQAVKDAFPTTAVIQYVNMPPEAIQALADYSKSHGVGFGGPDIYPSDPVLTNPQRGVYRLYTPLSGIVPLGAAVQQNDYTQKTAFRGGGGETPVKEIYEFGRDQLHLNYIFWGTRSGYFEKVQAMLAAPSFPHDPAGGLNAARPKSLAEPARR